LPRSPRRAGQGGSSAEILEPGFLQRCLLLDRLSQDGLSIVLWFHLLKENSRFTLWLTSQSLRLARLRSAWLLFRELLVAGHNVDNYSSCYGSRP
jgi:hypothetical protein